MILTLQYSFSNFIFVTTKILILNFDILQMDFLTIKVLNGNVMTSSIFIDVENISAIALVFLPLVVVGVVLS